MKFIQPAVTIISGFLALSLLVVITLAEITIEEDIAPSAIHNQTTGSDNNFRKANSPTHLAPPTQQPIKATKPCFPSLYNFFHPQTVKK